MGSIRPGIDDEDENRYSAISNVSNGAVIETNSPLMDVLQIIPRGN